MKRLGILLFSLLFYGTFLVVKCVYLSNQVSDSICEQHQKFTESGELQKPVKSGAVSGSRNDACGWYQVKKGQEAGCAAAVATFFECEIIDQRQSKRQSLAKPKGSGRIVGGEDAKPHEFPSIVAFSGDGYNFCSSTLISAEYVVTAAHCCSKDATNPNYSLIAGLHKRGETDQENPAIQRRKIVAMQVHEKYVFDVPSQQYDIALLKVEPPFELNDNVKIATLPDPEYRADEEGDGSTILQKVDVPFVDDESCNATYAAQTTPYVITEDMICAGYPEGGKDSCQGDSGGPMYKIDGDKQILAGITSFGTGCARPGIPGVYTETAYFISWIKKHTCIQ